MFGPLPLILLGALVIGVTAGLIVDRASSGQHHWFRGNQWAIPTGDAMTATRHAWRRGGGRDTFRVEVIARRIADEEARLAAQDGRHHLAGPVPADEGQADAAEVLYTHGRPLLRIAS